MRKIDRIDERGDIREHWTTDDVRTICGVQIGGNRQEPAGNRECKRCLRVGAQRIEAETRRAFDEITSRFMGETQ